MRILIVGLGSIGKRHLDILSQIPNTEFVICTKSSSANLPKKFIKSNSLSHCLQKDPDVAFVTNVTSEHVPALLKIGNKGIDVFVEKPLSNSLIGLTKLQNLIQKKKLITMVGCNLRFHKCIQKIKETISNDEIGKIISAKVESGSYLPAWHPHENYRKSYASRKELGGGVVLTCIHEIDYLYWFFGPVKEVISMTGKYSDLEISVDDLSAILMKFKNGVTAEIHLDYFQRPDFRSCKIIGTKGTVYWDSNTNTVKLYDVKKKKWIIKMKLKNYNRNDMFMKEVSYFLNSVKKRKKTLNPISDGIETLKIALKIIQSSKSKKVLRI